MKKIAILGSTGSIGQTALRVVENLGTNFIPVALSAKSNVHLLCKQALKYNPKVISILDPESTPFLKSELKGRRIQILSGQKSLDQIAEMPDVDIIINGIMGSTGFFPTLSALKKGKTVCLANKETLVSYGSIISKELKKTKSKIIPVDSEHSAIFQCINGKNKSLIERIILTSSGGPFRKRENLTKVTVDEALNHPVWKMGRKISIDSATMMNKALEIIEAHFLFGIPADKISVVIHPECIVHSAVEFVDSSVIAQLSTPDMSLPIQYAITYPERVSSITKPLCLPDISHLTFEAADKNRFPALSIAYRSLEKGGTTTAVLNAADEFLVHAFLKGKITLNRITSIVAQVVEKHTVTKDPSIEQVQQAEKWAQKEAQKCI